MQVGPKTNSRGSKLSATGSGSYVTVISGNTILIPRDEKVLCVSEGEKGSSAVVSLETKLN